MICCARCNRERETEFVVVRSAWSDDVDYELWCAECRVKFVGEWRKWR